MKRFELRKSPVDGKVRRWDTMKASEVVGLDADPEAPEGWDYQVSVCTGVFDNKKEALRAAGLTVR